MIVIWIIFSSLTEDIDRNAHVSKSRSISDLFSRCEEIDRQICRETYSSGIPASFVLCNFRANINTLCSAAPSRSTLDSAPCIGLYVVRKQTNQYQSLKFPWLHGTFHFKWDERLWCLRLKGKRENYRMITHTEEQTFMRSMYELFSTLHLIADFSDLFWVIHFLSPLTINVHFSW